MKIYKTRKYSILVQTFLSIGIILAVSLTSFFSRHILGYKSIAIILLMSVSVLAMLFDIVPTLIASILSAMIWNYFFIPPVYTFHIGETEDVLMFTLYFVVALLNAVLNFQIKKEEKKSRDKEEQENTIKLYNTLLNSLSHELRTPISTIISSVDTLKENATTLSISNQDEILDQIDIAAIRLNRQVENLLNMSRLESGTLKLNIEWIDINDLIFSTIQKLKPYSQRHTIHYESQSNFPLCKLDAGIIEQVLYNILFNSIQYTPPNSIITIDTIIDKEILTIHVTDNGNGIPENLISKIFDKFYRLPNSKTGGTGLGLSIAKGFVEAHRGNLSVMNISPKGLKFSIELPIEISYINNLKNE